MIVLDVFLQVTLQSGAIAHFTVNKFLHLIAGKNHFSEGASAGTRDWNLGGRGRIPLATRGLGWSNHC